MIKLGLVTSFAIGTTLLAGLGSQTGLSQSSEYPNPTIREEQSVVVGGVAELWRLKWRTPPKPVCEPNQDSLTCPCEGFAYGEAGHLTLVRLRGGTEVDHLDLAPFFDADLVEAGGLAVVQRWEPDYDKDYDAAERRDFPALVAQRRTAQVMYFADYEHDGWGSEFYLQTESGPCGHRSGVVIGVSKSHPRLHAVGTVAMPGKPLYLREHEWEALRRASGPIEVVDSACGDHGAETEIRLWLRWAPEGVDGTRREYACMPNSKPGKLLHEEPFSPASKF